MSVEAPCPLNDFPSIRACTSTCPRLSRPGVTDWTARFKTSTWRSTTFAIAARSEEHTSELQSQSNLVCRLLLEKKNPHQTHIVVKLVRVIEQSIGDQRQPRLDEVHDRKLVEAAPCGYPAAHLMLLHQLCL